MKRPILLAAFCAAAFIALAQQPAPDYLKDPDLYNGTRQYLKVLNASITPWETLPVKDARQILVNMQHSVRVDYSGIEESERTITAGDMTVRLHIVRPAGKRGKLPVFVFIHGGGWVMGDYPTHRRLVRDLVVESGYACVFPDYSLSPEAKYPVAIQENYAAMVWVAQNGSEIDVDGSNMAVVGNDVGGTMALSTAIGARLNNYPRIKCLVAMCPAVDRNTDHASWSRYGKQRYLTASLMEWMYDHYTDEPSDPKEVFYSPSRATREQLRGFPPTLITVAENDILRDGAESMARKFDQAGVDITTVRFNGVVHDWGLLNAYAKLPQTRALVTLTASWMKTYMEE